MNFVAKAAKRKTNLKRIQAKLKTRAEKSPQTFSKMAGGKELDRNAKKI